MGSQKLQVLTRLLLPLVDGEGSLEVAPGGAQVSLLQARPQSAVADLPRGLDENIRRSPPGGFASSAPTQPDAVPQASSPRCIGRTAAPREVLYFHTDHLGTPVLVTDANGAVLSRHKYLPFGEEMTPVEISTHTRRFTGHERNIEIHSEYMLSRSLPTTAPFMSSPDPTYRNVSLTRPSSWLAYAYVEDNPILFIDPDGLARPTMRMMQMCGAFHTLLIWHPVFIFNDGTTVQFGPADKIGLDPDPFELRRLTIIDGLDDKRLRDSMEETNPTFDTNWGPRSNNCWHYAEAVMQEYSRRLLSECRAGTPKACAELRDFCKKIDWRFLTDPGVCQQYHDAKRRGELPKHDDLGGWGAFLQ